MKKGTTLILNTYDTLSLIYRRRGQSLTINYANYLCATQETAVVKYIFLEVYLYESCCSIFFYNNITAMHVNALDAQ